MSIEERDGAAAPWLQGPQPDHPGVAIERLPGLAFALEQFALNVREALAPLCKARASGTMEEMKPTSLFELLGECEGRTAAMLHCAPFDARLLLIFDPRIVDTLVAAVFGGSAADRDASLRARPNRPRTRRSLRAVPCTPPSSQPTLRRARCRPSMGQTEPGSYPVCTCPSALALPAWPCMGRRMLTVVPTPSVLSMPTVPPWRTMV